MDIWHFILARKCQPVLCGAAQHGSPSYSCSYSSILTWELRRTQTPSISAGAASPDQNQCGRALAAQWMSTSSSGLMIMQTTALFVRRHTMLQNTVLVPPLSVSTQRSCFYWTLPFQCFSIHGVHSHLMSLKHLQSGKQDNIEKLISFSVPAAAF